MKRAAARDSVEAATLAAVDAGSEARAAPNRDTARARAAERPRLTSKIVPVRDLDPRLHDEMWAVFSRYYEGVTRESFEKDLAPKDHVILLFDAERGSVQGFSTLQVTVTEVRGRRVVSLFSGDTIVDAAYWGQNALQKAFYRYIVRTKFAHPFTPVYWFLISKGYKTYLLLSRNYRVYWPRHDRPTPAWETAVLDRLAGERFGDDWRPELGIIRFSQCNTRLHAGVAPVDAEILAYPDIRFFVERNPGHCDGDELACLGLIDFRLFISWPLKLARRAAA
ncbi:MAG: hypothetical protein KC466_17385, partial [Myxococcales bacterium]|nr:hypothetical protein [Myxococcales bacterium]